MKECNSCTNKPREECPNGYCIEHCSLSTEHELKDPITTDDIV